MPVAYIGLGSNLGDREANLRRAIEQLDATPGVRVTAVSSFHETESMGGPAGAPPYRNAVAALETTLTPWPLLLRLMQIELVLGRRRPDLPNAPRTLDLDLLLYGKVVQDDPRLVLPHPRMLERAFVLEPLREIAPDIVRRLTDEKSPD